MLGDSAFNLVLLDVMLPGRSGLDLCRDIRKTGAVPIIMVSARNDEIDLTFLEKLQRVIGRERLIELSRTPPADSSDRSIDVLVSRLRRKLGQEDRSNTATIPMLPKPDSSPTAYDT